VAQLPMIDSRGRETRGEDGEIAGGNHMPTLRDARG
jgi:hypothetical protein